MRVLIERTVDAAVPADRLWSYVTDWPRQGEWVPHTRVELVDPADPAHAVGGRIRAWSGLGPIGFWDTMTITGWREHGDGGGRCEVLHTGAVVRGEGEFVVEATGPSSSRFIWKEMAVLPLGRLGALGWRVVHTPVERLIDRGLDTMRRQVENTAH
ncbi:SRPBCC family protein [Nocardioides mesophilus]|uniref:SRPBCC family protein n=1 Tax=Nocardioides mesophilus TaxID=433659 RepID=A0A7G9R7Z7_9ACTN|nr:SRPBCC family protein [Nocardioides mesophilus]QNN51722.1 SRPBCC family protein [Nocardioides mesophilus]